MYKVEKMYVFYAQKNETAILSDSILKEPFIRAEVLGIECYSNRTASFLTPYYTNIYKDDKYVKIKLLPENQAIQEFYSRGGKFEHGEIEEARFTKLLDKDFVLNTHK